MYGWGGLLKPHAVGRVRLKRTGCHTVHGTTETDRLKQGEVDVFSLATTRVAISCDLRPFLQFSPKRQTLIGWRTQFIRLKYSVLFL